jgi:branched-chain amino acid aminotransferase
MKPEFDLTEAWGEVYINGKVVHASEAVVSLFDRGFLYGDGIYETLRVYQGKPFMLDAHIERMAKGCSAISLAMPAQETIKQGVYSVLEANSLKDAYLRITVTRGPTGQMWYDIRAEQPTVVIFAKPYTAPDFGLGVRLIVSRFRTDERSPLSGVKQIGILPKIMARLEAVQAGADDALLLDSRGYVSEATSSNAFWVVNGRLFTPSLSCGILPGITRRVVIELAKESGLEICEGEFELDEVFKAQEAFLTSSTWEIVPVASVDGVTIGSGLPNPVTQYLQRLYSDNLVKELGL